MAKKDDLKISVLVHTLNEEKNIRCCLECLKWADEIIVIDMYSDDRTVEIAREYTHKIFMYQRMRYVEPARRFGLQQVSNQWVLVVDADELVPLELSRRLIEIAAGGQHDAVLIPRRNYIFGRLMRESGWGAVQDAQLRFFRKQYMNYTAHIHSGTQLDSMARIYKITDESCSFIHFNYIDTEQFLEKLNRYTTIEAENAWDGRDKFSKGRVVRHILREFKNRYLKNKGYRDGFEGFMLAILMCTYRAVAGFKRYLMECYETKQAGEAIERCYAEIRDREIDKYSK